MSHELLLGDISKSYLFDRLTLTEFPRVSIARSLICQSYGGLPKVNRFNVEDWAENESVLEYRFDLYQICLYKTNFVRFLSGGTSFLC
jgi:hypothetical protein